MVVSPVLGDLDLSRKLGREGRSSRTILVFTTWPSFVEEPSSVEDMNGFLAKCLLMGLATGTVALIIGPDYAEAVALSTGGFLDVLGKLFGRNAETSKK
ncbi:hypothetical protein MRX96_003289 [Rhipicephalus microplus]